MSINLISQLVGAANNTVPETTFNSTDPNQPALNLHDLLLPLLGSAAGLQLNPLFRALMLVNNALGELLGLDPTIIITTLALAWASIRLARQLWFFLWNGVLLAHLTSTVSVCGDDDIFDHIMGWIAAQPPTRRSRALIVETAAQSAWEERYGDATATRAPVPVRVLGDDSGAYLNFSNQDAETPPRFIPALGCHGFWFERRYFRINRRRETFWNNRSSGFDGALREKETMEISTFGFSPDPIKRFLQHAKDHYYKDHSARTLIKRPANANHRRFHGGRNSWLTVASRPVRPMSTVVLDRAQKARVLADVNEYLHPATPYWYAARGIPMRRGYLFHGPPGTGKTSLSFALAGVFGLDIYVVSLMEPQLTEEDLCSLFNSLPRRCVVLLEDIDTAGLGRAPDAAPGSDDATEGGGGVGGDRKPHRGGISLSGLLNAIDGVASHEGRVLIMTTNRPEALDAALIRPGRVDLQVAFGNATRRQAVELFKRMYEPPAQPTGGVVHSAAAYFDDGKDDEEEEELVVDAEELGSIAAEFGLKIPNEELSPAEIQGFLLKRKKSPRRAVREVEDWVRALAEQKATNSKVQQVQ